MARLADRLGASSGSRVQVVTRTPSAPALVSADPSRFDAAIVNMAVDAKRAMEGKGIVRIIVEPVESLQAPPPTGPGPAHPGPAAPGG